jgi:membrane-bound serine protease (ClpP class)
MSIFLESPLLINLLYLSLVAGLWLSAWAIITPGTGVLEGLAIIVLVIAGLGMAVVPINAWALGLLAAGVVLFGLSVWRKWTGVWLGLSALTLSLGSVFLFRLPEGDPTVHPILAIVVSLLTVGFFWLILSKALEAYRGKLSHDPTAVLNKIGEVRTAIDPIGSVYVAGELWTATAEIALAAGTIIRVVGREGLTLVVEPNDPKHAKQ